MVVRALVASLVCIGASVTSVAAQQTPVSPLGLLEGRFERNAGQVTADAEFVARGSGFDLLLTRNGAVVRSGGHRDVRLDFTGGAQMRLPIGESAMPGVVNYLVGNDPSQWRTNIVTFERVRYADVYPGIDVVYHASQGQMEYDVVLDPGADPRRVRMRFSGADRVELESTGDLAVHVNDRVLTVRKPVLYQGNGDSRRLVDGAFIQLADGDVGFDVGRYDSTAPLVIDPVLVHSSYLPMHPDLRSGLPAAMVVSSDGAVYITGTGTGTFAGLAQFDTFVAKVNPSGASLAFVTYLGGAKDDFANAIALGPSGAIYVAGHTSSHNFPVASAAQAVFGGDIDAFLAKLAPTGDRLEFATFAGGYSTDGAEGLAVDGDENVFLAGSTFSPDFPLLSSPRTYGGNRDGFVARYDVTGAMLYSMFLAGNAWTEIHAARLAPDGTLVVAGETAVQSFPVTPEAFDTTLATYDGFVARLRATDGHILQATLLGGENVDEVRAIYVDVSNAVYVTGETSSPDFPTTAGAVQPVYTGSISFSNAFATKFNPTLSAVVYSTYLGGSSRDSGSDIAVDGLGQAVVTGLVQSNDFPQFNPLYPLGGGPVPPSFITKLSANGTQFVYSMYWPASGTVATVGPSGDAYLAGAQLSSIFVYPTTPDALLAPASIGIFLNRAVFSRIGDASPSCTYTVHPQVYVVGGSITSRSLGVVAPSGCFWTVTSDDPTWLTPTTTSGTGVGVITFVASALLEVSRRTGTLTVGNGTVTQAVTVIQRFCTITSATQAVQPDTGGPLVVNLTGTPGCAWVAFTDASWISLTPTVGYLDDAGQGQLTLALAPNVDNASRTATVFVGDTARSSGTQIQIQQAGRCTAALSFMPFGAHRTGSSTPFAVSVTPPDCQWTAKADVPWLVPAVSSGIGSQTISVTASANTAGARTGHLVIAGQAATLVQNGPSFSETPKVYPPSPAFGSGHAQTFTFTFYDSNGANKLDVVNVLFNNFLDGRSACYLAYARASNVLYLVNDQGDALLPGLVLNGGFRTVGNSQCEIDGSGSSAVLTGTNNNSLVLTLKMAFSAQFEGNKVVYQAARNVTGFNSGWVQQGVWNVPAQTAPPLEVRSMTTARNSGSGFPFQFMFRNLAGADQLVSTTVLINNYLDGSGGCYLGYHVPTNSILLVNDAGNGYLPGVTLGDNSTIENSQCRIEARESSAELSGTDLTLNLMIEFKAGFAGDRVFYLSAQDGVATSGWQAIGSWTVP